MKSLFHNAIRACCIAVMFVTTPVHPQITAPQGATDITVRLFFSQNVDALTITPASQSVKIRRCSHCSDQLLQTPLSIRLKNAQMLINNSPTNELEVAGAVRVETAGGRTAVAAGRWRLHPARDGLHLAVTVPSERYVMAVLASEASPQEPAASLQALAISARSFALTHFRRHSAEGFDLCDNTHCQALRLGPVSDAIRSAVDSTAGETIWLRGRRATAYFTQNCGGVTASAAQLWGGPPQPWLVSHPDPWCQRTPSAWHASLSQEELHQALRLAGSPTQGAITNIVLSKRNPSGRAATITFVTADQNITLAGATFRFAVGRALGWNRLRSDWYAVNLVGGVAQFDGKGFGHGVGLCQAGAAAMAVDQHADMRSILHFYFPGTEVRISASDEGWHSIAGQGWTLIDASSAENIALLREGDVAWSHAHSLLGNERGGSADDKVSVRIFPSTELFRVSTGQPGWVIGTTRGNTISLQPVRIIEAHESLQDALLHEMLHVLVERDSTASTPLWLREGLVETLATGNSSASREGGLSMSAEEINSELANASSLDQASRAHHDAATLVRRFINIYGISTVRDWLSSGIPPSALAQAGTR